MEKWVLASTEEQLDRILAGLDLLAQHRSYNEQYMECYRLMDDMEGNIEPEIQALKRYVVSRLAHWEAVECGLADSEED